MIGLGYVGLPTAVLIARAGFKVLGYDPKPNRVERIQAGADLFEEPELNAVTSHFIRSGAVRVFNTLTDDLAAADIYIICVPTPITADKRPDVSIVEEAGLAIAPYLSKGNMVLLESTSPVATTRGRLAPIFEGAGLDPLNDLDVAYCPERVLPGNTIAEITRNDRVVGGLTERASGRAKQFYSTFCRGHISETSAEAAEFSKLAENTYRDVNIALANEMAELAQKAGVNIREVIALANRHPRVNLHEPGSGVGGHCIPVDPWFLHDIDPDSAPLIRTARTINDDKPVSVVSQMADAMALEGQTVCVLGYAYRGDIGDWRDSPAITAVSALLDRGAHVDIVDPHVDPDQVPAAHGTLFKSAAQALTRADTVLVMTAHSEFKAMDMTALQERGVPIFDPTGLLG